MTRMIKIAWQAGNLNSGCHYINTVYADYLNFVSPILYYKSGQKKDENVYT